MPVPLSPRLRVRCYLPIRGSGLAVAGFAQWIANAAISVSFPTLAKSPGLALTYTGYAVFAAISFFWYYAAIVIMGGAVGYALGVGFFDWLGLGTGFIVVLIGLVVGAIFAIGTFMLGVPILLVMVFSAFSGAAAVVNGVLILFGTIKLETLNEGIFGALFAQGIVGTVIFRGKSASCDIATIEIYSTSANAIKTKLIH